MREWLTVVTEYAIVAIEALALVIIVAGTIAAFVNGLRVMLCRGRVTSGATSGCVTRWLVAGLTFQLAADIIETSITTG